MGHVSTGDLGVRKTMSDSLELGIHLGLLSWCADCWMWMPGAELRPSLGKSSIHSLLSTGPFLQPLSLPVYRGF